ncbi:potassium channel family protein [Phaeocystidibacter luteus]|uniref:TrkA family potassium uptake protein n=1 Tax=Phaeocystidibacter luteus TaxID=911197 RepID=A0A6N6RKR2_9FLAO|nr:TrkA family potassium uptake protein [Phaeocystidibacter luteus]KAB2808643.1 TrkA family potassium uptake protein [Phaeocystidibacter luteus]NVK27984.1 TrkA family potassium uptake protein [Flavobacteriia bacterium]
MADKFAVIGLGQFGSAIARKLSQKGAEVIAIDTDEEKVEAIREDVAYAVTLDATDQKALESQDMNKMDAVIVSIGQNFQDLLLCCFQLQEMEIGRIIARAQGATQRRILEKMGIQEILSPEDEVANNVAEQLMNPGVVMCFELPDGYEIVEIKAPKALYSRTLGDIGLREKYKLNLVTLLREENNEHHIYGVPDAETIVEKGDIIVVFGTVRDIERFIEINS